MRRQDLRTPRRDRTAARSRAGRAALGALSALAALAGAGLLSAAPASAATLDLYAAPQGGTTACTEAAPCGLAVALSAAATAHPGAPIKVSLAAGTYSASFDWADSATSAPSSLTLAGPASGPGATLDSGGAGPDLVVDAPAGTTVLDGLTLTGGSAPSGGGIDEIAGTLHVEASTLFGNAATVSGGAIAVASGTALLEGSTLAANAGASDGAIATAPGTSVTLHADVLAANGAAPACAGVSDAGYDVTDDASCLGAAAATGSVVGAAPALDAELFGTPAPALSPAGSPGAVVDLAGQQADPAFDDVPGSVAALAGSGSFCAGHDERGAARLQAGSSSCDSGAMQLSPAVIASVSPGSGPPGTTVTVTGSGFLLERAVTLGGAAVQVHLAGDRSLSLTVPSLGAGPQVLTVTTPDGSATLASAFVVIAPLAVATTALPAAEVGVPYTATLAGAGGTPPYSWSPVGGLPGGLGLSPAGVLSGRPVNAGTVAVVVQVSDAGHQHAEISLALVVDPAPSTATATLPPAGLGQLYATTLEATGGVPPYTWAVAGGALPAGLVLDSDGTLAGRPGTVGTSTIAVRVTDSLGSSSTGEVTLTVTGSPPPPQRYGVLDASGRLAASDGSVVRLSARRGAVAGVAAAAHGWWVATRAGRVVGLGGARSLGSLPAAEATSPVAGIVAVHGGYLLATTAGRVVAFGHARPVGSVDLAGTHRHVVGIAAAATGGGCWLLESNGLVAALGRARPLGSPPLHERLGRYVGIATDAAGTGYWVVTGAGRVLAFGSATGDGPLDTSDTGPVVGIAAAPQGSGYWLLTSSGVVFAFGSARLAGPEPGASSPGVAAAVGATGALTTAAGTRSAAPVLPAPGQGAVAIAGAA